jgi:hypothetical protein
MLVERQRQMPDTLEELRALEREVEREWGGCTVLSMRWRRSKLSARPASS